MGKSRSYPKIDKSLSFPNALVPTFVSLSRNPDRIVGIGNPQQVHLGTGPDEAMTGPPIKTFGGDSFGISSNHLKGRTAIVTGATRGLGRAIALRLASEGAHVAFNYLNNKELADSLSKEIQELGVSALPFQVDIKDFKKVQEMKDAVLKEFNTFDILINNAGITKDKLLAMMSEEDWDSVVDTNLKGTFNMTRACVFTFLKQKSGDIINISSLSGIMGIAGQTNYSASKGGIISFTKSLAKEVAPFHVRVNAVAPGFIETDMVTNLDPKKTIDLIPMKRLGTPEEVAEVVNFLLKKEAGYITGQVIQIDGGLGM